MTPQVQPACPETADKEDGSAWKMGLMKVASEQSLLELADSNATESQMRPLHKLPESLRSVPLDISVEVFGIA